MAKKNYNYGKIEDGKLVYAPNMLKSMIEDEEGNPIAVQIINASAEQYAAQGWLQISRTPQPEPVEGGYYAAEYTELDGVIVESWTFVPYEEEENA